MTMLKRAIAFAINRHGDQKRRYTDLPYVTHCVEVAKLVRWLAKDADDEMLCAAVLHDVVEDTPCTLAEVRAAFGDRVASLVSDLTDVSRPEDGNRALRKAKDREHTANASPDAKTIKLADLIHNSIDICDHDPSFAKVYMREKKMLLDVLTEGDPSLWKIANNLLRDYEYANRN